MIKGLIFDLNGTLINIRTDETDDNLYRVTANYLGYYGIFIEPWLLKKMYFELNRQQRNNSCEEFPEFDSAKIFEDIIRKFKTRPLHNIKHIADNASIVYRAAGRFKLECYNGVFDCLNELKKNYTMAAVSDGQALWAKPELQAMGLEKFFSAVIISGELGYRKPDQRIFNLALAQLSLQPDEAVFVGNDMYRDIYGAHAVGLKTVFFCSDQGDHNYHGANADYIIYDFWELPKAIDFLSRK